jgi:photosystem II stability/assembly factor-like uncharacterized protein
VVRVVVVIGTEKGAFVCTSGAARAQWEVEGPLLKGWRVTASARTASGRCLVATASPVYGVALHGGPDFRQLAQIDTGPAYPQGGERRLNQIWTLHAGPAHLFAGVDEAGLFRSGDEGDTWEPLAGLNDHPTRSAWFPGGGGLCAHAVLTDGPDRIWCGISAVGVWRSDDGGRTWAAKNEGVTVVIPDKQFPGIGCCVHGLAHAPGDPRLILRQDHSGMYRTRDGGDHWERIENGLPGVFGFPLAMDPSTGTAFSVPLESDEYRMPVGGAFRVYRTRDAGESWEALGNGLPASGYHATVLRGAMAVDGLEPAGVYVGTTAGDVFATADGGESWQALPCRLPRIASVEAYVED